ncbi:MAG: hypothetical protein WBP02_01160 [Gammaproteobacteria bacterium]|jgi:hypothetical protein
MSQLSIASVFLSILMMSGCSSDDDGGGTATTVPPNAVTITEANAKDVVMQATLGGSALIDFVPVAADVAQAPSANDIIVLAVDKVKDISNVTALNLPVAEEINLPCDLGSITGTGTETETSASGTITFNDCVIGTVTLTGTITFNASINLTTQDWTINMTGNLSAADSTITTTLSGLIINETGNDLTGEFSLNTYTFALDYSTGGGFLAQLLAPIVGNELQVCPVSPRSGIVLVTGADNTQGKGTINSDGTVTVEYNSGSGAFVEVTDPPPGSPYPCANFFD